MVGDEDQSIYGFRAAYPKALIEFDKTYKNSKILLMETNYRSTPQILNPANYFIKQNKNRKDKNIIPYKKSGDKIEQRVFNNIEEQYNYIIQQAKNSKEKLAILYRNNESAIPLVNLFQKNNLKFSIKEGDLSFFSHYIVRDIINFINFYLDQNNIDKFKAIYYKINCGITKELINELEKRKTKDVLTTLIYLDKTAYWQRKKLKTIKKEFLIWKNKNSYQILESILKTMEYEKFIDKKSSETKKYEPKISILFSLAIQNPKIIDFLKRIDELEEIIKNGRRENLNLVLSTIHGSKGLEYNRVMLIDMISGIMPAVEKTSDEKSKKFEEYEEEVRLFYVAITRAKEKLEILTYQTAYGKQIIQSPFIKEIL